MTPGMAQRAKGFAQQGAEPAQIAGQEGNHGRSGRNPELQQADRHPAHKRRHQNQAAESDCRPRAQMREEDGRDQQQKQAQAHRQCGGGGVIGQATA